MAEERVISEMTIDELEDYREKIRASKINIDNSLAQARARKVATGEYCSPHWYCQQTMESKKLYGLYEQINREIRFKKKLRAEIGILPNFFMDIARAELPPDVFNSIHKKAKEARTKQIKEAVY